MLAALLIGVFVVAVLYSSVGHGGASGYLAVLTLFAVSPKTAATGALLLNVLVAGMAWATFRRAGHFSWLLVWPFALGSVPAAFAGGALKTSEPALHAILSIVLVAVAAFMMLPKPAAEPGCDRRPGVPFAAGLGAGLGFLSGIVGVGGGIFLSPIMVLRRWASQQRVAATAACFIVINSIAGLAGRAAGGMSLPRSLLPLVGAAFLGGLAGSWLGARRLTPFWLRRLLAVVLLVAAGKMMLQVVRG
ncbi:MAG: sulfite exporter TauE/SafE family protein [Planctomycetes bacterium]|nr:sulfite exporter TauE/SafE family protein [Planctomycetota bacterium]